MNLIALRGANRLQSVLRTDASWQSKPLITYLIHPITMSDRLNVPNAVNRWRGRHLRLRVHMLGMSYQVAVKVSAHLFNSVTTETIRVAKACMDFGSRRQKTWRGKESTGPKSTHSVRLISFPLSHAAAKLRNPSAMGVRIMLGRVSW